MKALMYLGVLVLSLSLGYVVGDPSLHMGFLMGVVFTLNALIWGYAVWVVWLRDLK
jgi:uncharacterized membrane protein